jgi:choline dehydrogenase-like flavoprotein
MILDSNELDADTELQADLCIVGAGAAGITIAREFVGARAKIIVLESGAANFEQETQALYAGRNVGRPYDLVATRLRFFGGTTNHWEGVCAPLSEIDFEVRPWVPASGWPITRSDLIPFYKRAQSVVKLGPFLYDDDVWGYLKRNGLSIDRGKIRYNFRQMREFPIRFGEEYGDELRKAPNIRVFLHANVVNIQLDSSGRRVEYVDVRSLRGKSGRVSARYFVLACGGIENARILLVSNSVETPGVGNRHDLVGRYFQEHPQFVLGTVFPTNEERFRTSFQQGFANGIRFLQHLVLSPAAQRQNSVLDSLIFPNEIVKPDTGMAAAREIMADLRSKREIEDLDKKIWQILRDLDDVVINTYRRFVLDEGTLPPLARIELKVESEQAPNPESRVTLLPEKDALGLNRTRLNWLLTDIERRTAVVLAKTVAAEFGRLGLARVKLNPEMLQTSGSPPGGFGFHQMGTTRMANDPTKGVVDRNCLVHGLGNLYIAGSSIFPTGGSVNPTLTIVALALRLSDHLKSRVT